MTHRNQTTDTKGSPETETTLLRPKRIEVDNLFGIFDHRIDLNLDDHVTLIHGPNGVGKTVILRMIDALLRGRLYHFTKIPFSRFFVRFQDDSEVSIIGNGETLQKDLFRFELVTNGEATAANIMLKPEADYIASQIDYIRPHDATSDTWVDIRDGERISSDTLVTRFRDTVDLSSNFDTYVDQEAPWFAAFLRRSNSHYIQEQRLFSEADHQDALKRRFWGHQFTAFVPTVVEYSKDFQDRISKSTAAYGRKTQELEQSFLQRLMSDGSELDENELRDEMTTLEKRITYLDGLGILEQTSSNPFSAQFPDRIDPSQLRAMTLYVKDTKEKLAVLDDFARRSSLLLTNINEKFQHKSIRLDQDKGLVAQSSSGDLLPLDALSSGEQHELVLHYDLLFRIPPNTLVLIDEPELSLHVAWQNRFMADLLEIVQVSGFDILVATHSPYVTGVRKDLMVSLGGRE